MHHKDKVILVSGATGRQGGAVARHLLVADWRVRAFSRNPAKPAARELAELGIEVIQGDLNERSSLDRALKGVHGVFSVQDFWETGAEGEIRQGKLLADAAREACVQHFVYSSVGGADRAHDVPHFQSKWQVEQHIRSLELPTTILRPVFFMDNFLSSPLREGINAGQLSMAMDPDTPLQMVAVDDIGAFAAMALGDPQEYLGKTLELAGDELPIPRAAEVFSRVLGRPVEFHQVPMEQLRAASAESAVMFEWFNREGYAADIPTLRRLYPPLMTLEAWLRRTDWARGIPAGRELAAHRR